MKILQIYFISIFLLVSVQGFSQEWELTWSDEFDNEGLPDDAKWDYFEGMAYNNESQYYAEKRLENSRVEKGMLVLEAISENYKGASYSSARIMTEGKKEFLYGKIEVRAKLPAGVGMWPAIWMLGTNRSEIGWPACGEIDIMENVGYDPDSIHGNVHTKAYNHIKGTNKGARIYVAAPYKDFHVYTVEWFEDHMDFFVDGNKYFSFDNEGNGNDVWPYDKPHYVILNVAVGGSWGGKFGIDESIFPQKMLVDYVRYYEKKKP
jgi:beta-glucanase (GH16 family)